MEILISVAFGVLILIFMLLWEIRNVLESINSKHTIDNERSLKDINQSIKNLEATLQRELSSTNK